MANLGTGGANLIKSHEGFSLKFYGDPVGYPTVGWGHLITNTKTYTRNTTGNPNTSLLSQAQANALSSSLNLGYTSPISQSKANTFFAEDTAKAVTAVNKLNLNFSQSQFDALVSLTFNGGSGVLATDDVQAMLANGHIYPTFIGPLTTAQLDTCSKLVSKAFSYDRKLQRRRNEEATLFCKGMKYTHKYPVYTL
ncbi:lysozyme [Paenibacillus donghaensis]|uniref:Lysozyme n=1 Tax=Paenibacillus donghaensis TaxID=414771 RepID=A0A2Z2KNQ6_9BACL|nr:lysozyme [Paenibacillus donghaensis]ASA25253.1 lysozyme [Paenibacillus donghaensis]